MAKKDKNDIRIELILKILRELASDKAWHMQASRETHNANLHNYQRAEGELKPCDTEINLKKLVEEIDEELKQKGYYMNNEKYYQYQKDNFERNLFAIRKLRKEQKGFHGYGCCHGVLFYYDRKFCARCGIELEDYSFNAKEPFPIGELQDVPAETVFSGYSGEPT